MIALEKIKRALRDNPRPKRPKTQKETATPDKDQDFISNLPEEVKSNILVYLSTRDAVKTSVLSARWRYTWASVPEISIREADFTLPLARTWAIRSRFVKFVDVHLYLHSDPIRAFELETSSFKGDKYYRDAFNIWILHLSRRNELRKFSYISTSLDLYKLPTCFFSCHGLSFLKLHGCHIKLPKGFQGFKSMSVLELQGCYFTSDDLEKLVSSCPILKELILKAIRSTADFSLKIYAPKLEKLIIHGRFASLLLKTPCLIKAYFELEVGPTGNNGRANLVDALGSLSEVEILGLHLHFFAYLAAGDLPNHLPFKLDKLKMLALDVNLSSPQEASLTRLLLQNAPNLQKIKLTNCTSGWPLTARLWKFGPYDLFTSLRMVEFFGNFISETETAFLQFILGSLPLLKQLTIVRDKDTNAKDKEAVLEILKGIPKVSRNLLITFK